MFDVNRTIFYLDLIKDKGSASKPTNNHAHRHTLPVGEPSHSNCHSWDQSNTLEKNTIIAINDIIV